MKKISRLTIIWAILLLIIVGLLTCFGFMYKSKTKVYKELENNLVEAAKKYVDAQFLYPMNGETLKVDSNSLIEGKYLENLKSANNSCTGYVNVKLDGSIYKYKGYVDCDVYTTKGYEH